MTQPRQMGLTLTKSLKQLADNETSSFCLEGYLLVIMLIINPTIP